MEYTYFIAYYATSSNEINGFGNIIVNTNQKINNRTIIKDIQQKIEKEYKLKDVVIVNFKKI